jgi:hypothetical protein
MSNLPILYNLLYSRLLKNLLLWNSWAILEKCRKFTILNRISTGRLNIRVAILACLINLISPGGWACFCFMLSIPNLLYILFLEGTYQFGSCMLYSIELEIWSVVLLIASSSRV